MADINDKFEARRQVREEMEQLAIPWLGYREADAYSAVLMAGLANEARLSGKKLTGYIESLGLEFTYSKTLMAEEFERSALNGGSRRYYQFAGEKANTADRLQLADAQKMDEEGADNETIRETTGWFKGMEKRWRFEIPDNIDKISIPQEGDDCVLGEVYDNEALYRAYPFLRNLEIHLKRLEKYHAGRYRSRDGVIDIDASQPEELKKETLLHEIQHAIQSFERFARGGYWKEMKNYGEPREKIDERIKKVMDFEDENPELRKKARPILDNMYSILQKERSGSQLDKKELSFLRTLLKKLGKLNNKDPEIYVYQQLYESVLKAMYGDGLGLDAYSRLAGEIEAWDAANRAKFSDEERRAIPPDMRDEAIILYGGKIMASIQDVPAAEKGPRKPVWQKRLATDDIAFKTTINDYKKKKLDSSQPITVMTTPLALTLAKAEMLPIKTKIKTLNKIVHKKKHLTENVLKKISESLADPIAIFESATRANDSIVVMLDLKHNNGNVIVPIAMSQQQGHHKVNKMTSAYPRVNSRSGHAQNQWVLDQLNRARYINREKITTWAQSVGLSSPLEAFLSGSVNIPDETDLCNLRKKNDDKYYQSAGQDHAVKGSSTFLDGKTVISLFESADRSTFLHETGHLFLESRRRLSLVEDIPQQVKDDWKTVTDWLDVSDLDFSKPFQGSDADRWRTAQEKWAAGFEQYLMEGNAPSPGLAHAFEDFKEWLSDIYRTAKNIFYIDERGESRPAEITNEVREVMGRILTDERDLSRHEPHSRREFYSRYEPFSRDDPEPGYPNWSKKGSWRRDEAPKEREAPKEFELQVGQKVLFRLNGSGTALNGNVIQFDEMEVKIRAGERNMTLRRDKGIFELLSDKEPAASQEKRGRQGPIDPFAEDNKRFRHGG
jgi:hypothetical protein